MRSSQSKPSQRTFSMMESTYSGLFLFGIGVVEAQVAFAAEFGGEAEVQADGFGVADVQIAVRLRGETRVHAAADTCWSSGRRGRCRGRNWRAGCRS